MYQLLDVAKGFLESMNIQEDYILCDFTMGNGYDTEYLCKKVPKGKVYAFDIQAQAGFARALDRGIYQKAAF